MANRTFSRCFNPICHTFTTLLCMSLEMSRSSSTHESCELRKVETTKKGERKIWRNIWRRANMKLHLLLWQIASNHVKIAGGIFPQQTKKSNASSKKSDHLWLMIEHDLRKKPSSFPDLKPSSFHFEKITMKSNGDKCLLPILHKKCLKKKKSTRFEFFTEKLASILKGWSSLNNNKKMKRFSTSYTGFSSLWSWRSRKDFNIYLRGMGRTYIGENEGEGKDKGASFSWFSLLERFSLFVFLWEDEFGWLLWLLH